MRPNDAAEVGERLELGSRVRTGDLSSSSNWTSEQAILQGFLLFFLQRMELTGIEPATSPIGAARSAD